jgi:rubrerythrin
MNEDQLHELLHQALETEQGGVQIYETAIGCASNPDLKKEWQEYLEQTQRHEEVLRELMETLGMDPDADSPGRAVVRHIGDALVEAMKKAQAGGTPEAAELVATECVVLAETKDHHNWELIGAAAKKAKGELKKALAAAHREVEDEEDEHLYHSTGWSRELWLESLGLPAVLPPPEEKKDVKTAIGAARAKASRSKML